MVDARRGNAERGQRPFGKGQMDQARVEEERSFRANQVRLALRASPTVKSRETAAKLARNLAPMLAAAKKARKDGVNLGKLVLRAGISENADESRLGRFRLPKVVDKTRMRAAIDRLNMNASLYLGLAEEAARMAGTSVDQAVLDLVDGTGLGTATSPSTHPRSRFCIPCWVGWRARHARPRVPGVRSTS